ncbi:anhydro-N-acetylmuramic acid kinase [Mucilaginibacter aquatilis]|uniref:Anhydro-N-acetylmuramic acid kinase n=1 Tax=Mucilaginibacter aquatilis TaxID=1517760 RepID=A0A6I4I9R3_9SPHI|nr:anhydro-N-acetylmuramic acid kinase [Mucilaginibacter aquatilis]MVN91717.1 anhydro-N-acetylmuramic acid kinase [Mucilaginibacter aquatilis]
MNFDLHKLYQIGQKPVKKIIGLMSGTSFDGLDIALCEFSGSGLTTKVKVSNFITKGYEPAFKEDLKSVFAKKTVDLEKLTLLNAFIGNYHAKLINEALKEWKVGNDSIDLIASHGQTIFHAPKHTHPNSIYGNATLQIGDADHIAVSTEIITLGDFRQKHIAAGGEGAPLAVYGDLLIFSDDTENRIMLNIGGISNFSFLPAGKPERFFSTDVGPGNTMIDQFVQAHYPSMYYDDDSRLGLSGKVNEQLLNSLLNHDFFAAEFPKTTGPELFNEAYLQNAKDQSGVGKLTNEDVIATLTHFSAHGIINAIEKATGNVNDFQIYLSGGGMYNKLLVSLIEKRLNKQMKSTADLGIHPDAKEAVLFALLANEAVSGNLSSMKLANGIPNVSMGKISFPH